MVLKTESKELGLAKQLTREHDIAIRNIREILLEGYSKLEKIALQKRFAEQRKEIDARLAQPPPRVHQRVPGGNIRVMFHKDRVKAGEFSTKARRELYEIERILEEEAGNMSQSERSWVNQRKRKLLKRIHDPSIRYLRHGDRAGRLKHSEELEITSIQNIINITKERP